MKFLSESINIYKPTIYSIYSICIRISGYFIFLGFLYTEFFLSFYLKFNFKFIYFFILYFFILLFFLKFLWVVIKI
jgi:succinate dehydrogenase/fumarate reductase cytochrome b subunit